MSIYGSNPSRSTWQFDGIFSNYSEMIRAKDSILYGRHVFVSSEAKIYQKTDSNESPFIEIGKVAPSFAEGDNNIKITPSKEEWPNTGTLSIDNQGQITMNLDLNSLKYVDDIRVERASILTANTAAIPFSNAVRIYTYPIESNIDTLEAEEQLENNLITAVPSYLNGFYLVGDGVDIQYIPPVRDQKAQIKLTAAPVWKQFPTTAAESVTIDYDDTEGAVSLNNMNYSYDPQSDTLIATIEDEPDNA